MNKPQIGSVTQIMTSFPSRREILRGLAGAGLGLGIARLPDLVEAKKKRKRKRKKKHKKVRPNEFGCFEVGDPCTSEADCCSGICEGKKCRAHDTGTCEQGGTGVCLAPTQDAGQLLKCNNDLFCFCFRTTAGSYYCAAPPSASSGLCADCQTDADCVALGYPPSSACAPVSQGHCSGLCESSTACLVPCGTELPQPSR